jgi:muconolactone delta-isomerase
VWCSLIERGSEPYTPTSPTSGGAIIVPEMPKYLVTMNLRRTDPLLPVDELTKLIRGAILPSVESLTQLKAQGKLVAGGYPIGRPAIVLLVEADSEEELHELLEGLPLWNDVEVEATRMQGFEELVNSDETAEP